MSAPKKYGRREVRIVIREHRQHGSIKRAAAAAGVSEGWAWIVLSKRGLTKGCPTYPAWLSKRAVEIYRDEGLSACRVAKELESRYGHAPTGQWVLDQVREAGAVRDHRTASRRRHEREQGKDYDALEREALRLALTGRMTSRDIARELDVSLGAVQDWLGSLRPSISRSREIREWKSPTVAAARRRERFLAVCELRRSGATYAAISDEVGVSRETVGRWLRRAERIGIDLKPERRAA